MRRPLLTPVYSRMLCVVVLALAGLALPARADLSGFRLFAPINTRGVVSVSGYSADRAVLTLTDGGPHEAVSAFSAQPQDIRAFRASFTYQAIHSAGDGADGIAFIVQNDPRGARALGGDGSDLGYGGAVTHSRAVRLTLYPSSGESLGTDGTAAVSQDTGLVDLGSGHPIKVALRYDGETLSETLTDTATGDTFSTQHDFDLAAHLGKPTAFVGLSGGSGSITAVQTVRDFVFVPQPRTAFAPPVHPAVKPPSLTTLSAYVNPLIGTSGGGNTFPGAVAPFGMVQLSPDTRAPSIGYYHTDHQIQGFSMTHMSGVGCDDEGDVFLTATTGPIKTDVGDYQSRFSHRQEQASPGFYQALLRRWNIKAEMTATERAGLLRFTFPAGQAGNVLLPISHTLTRTQAAQVRIVGQNEMDGQVTSQCFCGAQPVYTVYFVLRFDRPFASCGTFAGPAISKGGRTAAQTPGQPGVGAYVRFSARRAPQAVTARIGISYVDMTGARRNLAQEVGGRGFDAVHQDTARAWEKALHVIDVQGGTTDQRTVFYTSLYHCLLMPSLFSDTDGRYVGFDHSVHRARAGHAVYANFSGWDIYRTEAPLLALIAPQRMQDMCQSVALMYAQGGWIDRWPQANGYTNIMCGSPLTIMLATAWSYGLRDFDLQTAYKGMWRDATQKPPPGRPFSGESNIEYMNRVGYIPDDKEQYGSVSQTEEDCLAYAALAPVAQGLGKTKDAALLRRRALNYRNVFDPQTRFMRPRLLSGQWVSPFDPAQEHGYVEGSAWHYRWLVPQDVAGLAALMGGDRAFAAQLDTFFSYPQPVWNGRFYNPYNETDLQAPFLYDYCGLPWKTQARVRELQADAYQAAPGGIPGNDDCGTMSAWYVLSALGLYPVDPSQPGFAVCSPLFPQATLHLAAPYSGKSWTIRAERASKRNAFIQDVRLNGLPHNRPWLRQSAIARGGTLTVILGSQPKTAWGVGQALRPPSLSRTH